jgi:hypothetical protein
MIACLLLALPLTPITIYLIVWYWDHVPSFDWRFFIIEYFSYDIFDCEIFIYFSGSRSNGLSAHSLLTRLTGVKFFVVVVLRLPSRFFRRRAINVKFHSAALLLFLFVTVNKNRSHYPYSNWLWLCVYRW